MPSISGDIATLLGTDPSVDDPAALWVECSLPVLVVDSQGRTGGRVRVDLNDDGTFSVTGLPTTVGDVPLYRLIVESRSLRLAGNMKGLTTGWFPLTVDRDLTWIVGNYVPVTQITQQVALNVAAATALGDNNNTMTASFINAAGATQTALDARIASKVPSATDTTPGRVELATTAEVAAGLDTSRVVTPAGLAVTTQPVANIRAYGATNASASAGIQAAHNALPANGGVIVIPAGDWECSTTINITKQVEIRGAGGSNEFSNTRLRFAAGVKGFDVALPQSGDTFKMSDVALLSYSTSATAGAYGAHIKKGRPVITNCVAYSFGDHGWYFDSTNTAPPNNVNHAVLTLLRAYGNRGDGIRIAGPDSNAMTFINPDVVANYGWGINNMSPHNLFLHPHADQQYNGSPGAYRDDALSNRWEMVYSEGGLGSFKIDTNSGHGYISTSAFGVTPIIKSGTGHATWEIVRTAGARERVRSTNGTKDYVTGVGLVGTNTYDIVNVTDNVNLVQMKPDGSENLWYQSQNPVSNNTKDLGWSGGRWRDIFTGRYLYAASYTTAGRPSAIGATGAMIYDTTLGKPVWSNGSVWKDAAGTTV